jgi:hypothetical protein
MVRHPALDVPLNDVMRSQIALPLQHVLKLHTVGCLLRAWPTPSVRANIELLFESPRQARHAVATFAAWAGVHPPALADVVPAWWLGDDHRGGREGRSLARV